MFKMPEPIGCGYVVKWSSGDTHSTCKEGYAKILGVDVFTADQLKQSILDALEEAAVTAWSKHMDWSKKLGVGPEVYQKFSPVNEIRALKEQVK